MSVSWIFWWVWNTTLTSFGIPVAASRGSMVTSSFPRFTATRYPGNPLAFLVYIRRSPSLNTLVSPHRKDSLLLNSWSLLYTFRVVKLSFEDSSDCKFTEQWVYHSVIYYQDNRDIKNVLQISAVNIILFYSYFCGCILLNCSGFQKSEILADWLSIVNVNTCILKTNCKKPEHFNRASLWFSSNFTSLLLMFTMLD